MESFETRSTTPALRRAAARLLALEQGAAPATSETLAAASGRLLDQLSQRLALVIGPAGVRAILRRAVKLRNADFAFLDERMVGSDSSASVAEPFRARLQEQEPDVIREVTVALFATVTGLLASLIGDTLTWSLIEQIWPEAFPPRTERQETGE